MRNTKSPHRCTFCSPSSCSMVPEVRRRSWGRFLVSDRVSWEGLWRYLSMIWVNRGLVNPVNFDCATRLTGDVTSWTVCTRHRLIEADRDGTMDCCLYDLLLFILRSCAQCVRSKYLSSRCATYILILRKPWLIVTVVRAPVVEFKSSNLHRI